MTNGKKKPPISLSELEERGVEAPERGEPGGLSYVEEHGGHSGSEPYVGRDWKGLAGAIAAAVFIAGLLILFLTPSTGNIKTLDENIREVVSRVERVSTKMDKASADLDKRIDTAITEARSAKTVLGDYAKKSDIKAPDLSAYAKKTELPAPPDLSGYAKKTDLPDLSDYASKAYVDSRTTATGGAGATTSTSEDVTLQVLSEPQELIWADGGSTYKDYTFLVAVSNKSSEAKKIFIEGSAIPDPGPSLLYPKLDTALSGFVAGSKIGDSVSFTETFYTTDGRVFRAVGLSKGFFAMGPGVGQSFPVIFRLKYASGNDATARWKVTWRVVVLRYW